MSSPQRRAERKRQFDAESAARSVEAWRKEALDMWSRIEELDVGADLKDVLHRIAGGERE